MPKPTCKASGNRNGTAPSPIRNSEPPSTLARKVGIRSKRRSSSGNGSRRACSKYTYKVKPPSTIMANAHSEDSNSPSIIDKPSIISVLPTADRTKPFMSSGCKSSER